MNCSVPLSSRWICGIKMASAAFRAASRAASCLFAAGFAHDQHTVVVDGKRAVGPGRAHAVFGRPFRVGRFGVLGFGRRGRCGRGLRGGVDGGDGGFVFAVEPHDDGQHQNHDQHAKDDGLVVFFWGRRRCRRGGRRGFWRGRRRRDGLRFRGQAGRRGGRLGLHVRGVTQQGE